MRALHSEKMRAGVLRRLLLLFPPKTHPHYQALSDPGARHGLPGLEGLVQLRKRCVGRVRVHFVVRYPLEEYRVLKWQGLHAVGHGDGGENTDRNSNEDILWRGSTVVVVVIAVVVVFTLEWSVRSRSTEPP